MLDAHEDIRCGEETHVIPNLLNMHRGYGSPQMKGRLDEANIDDRVLDAALGEADIKLYSPLKFIIKDFLTSA